MLLCAWVLKTDSSPHAQPLVKHLGTVHILFSLFYFNNNVFCFVPRISPPEQDREPEPPMGAPPPYRLPPQPAMSVASPNGGSQYYPGSAQGDWQLGAFVSKIFMFDIRMCRVENRLDITIGSTEAYCSILLMSQGELSMGISEFSVESLSIYFPWNEHWDEHFTVVCLVAWPLNESEARGDLALI